MSGNFAIKGVGGVGRLMANAILNFHFDFLNTSLIYNINLVSSLLWLARGSEQLDNLEPLALLRPRRCFLEKVRTLLRVKVIRMQRFGMKMLTIKRLTMKRLTMKMLTMKRLRQSRIRRGMLRRQIRRRRTFF